MERRDFIKASFALGSGLAAPDVFARLRDQPTGTKTASFHSAGGGSGEYLFFVPKRIAALQTHFKKDAAMRARWKKLLQRADELVAGTRQESSDNGPAQMGMTLGLAWRITGDERYANKLRESLLKTASAPLKPGADADNHTPPWHSWLQTAGLVVNCAVGREALEGFLSSDERQRVTDGLMQFGILPILEDWVLPKQRIHALDLSVTL